MTIKRNVLRNRSGVAAVEFALTVPFLLVLGLWGAEIANMAIVRMRVAQLAMHLADNASRIGDTSLLTNRKIYEADLNDLIAGSNINASNLNFYEYGRAIISSLEVNGTNQQYIHWQRCKGKKTVASAYGAQGTVVPSGLGPTGEEVTAAPGDAVIFVEVTYDYQPLVSNRFFGPTTITVIESFTVRVSRDLSGAGIFQRVPASPDPVAACNVYTGVTNINI
jgi:Flp pilus assembly protein TadG